MPQRQAQKGASASSSSSSSRISQSKQRRQKKAKTRARRNLKQMPGPADEDALPVKEKPARKKKHRQGEKGAATSAPRKKQSGSAPAARQIVHVRVSGLEWNRQSKNAIRGYVHVPAGIPYMTRNCKALALERKKPVYYYVKPSAPTKRLGIQIPQEIFEEVHANFLSSVESRANLRDKRDSKITDEAADKLKRLFPKIPVKDASSIIKRGWERYSGRVGRGNSLSLEEKLLLATWAYIRHSSTDYDRRLVHGKENREEVRKDIRGKMLDVWKKWGGDQNAIGKVHGPRGHNKNNNKGGKAPRVDPVSGLSVGKSGHNLLEGALQRSRYLEEIQRGKDKEENRQLSTKKANDSEASRSSNKNNKTPKDNPQKLQLHGKLNAPTLGKYTVEIRDNPQAVTKLAGSSTKEAIVIDSDSEDGDNIWDQILEDDDHDWLEIDDEEEDVDDEFAPDSSDDGDDDDGDSYDEDDDYEPED